MKSSLNHREGPALEVQGWGCVGSQMCGGRLGSTGVVGLREKGFDNLTVTLGRPGAPRASSPPAWDVAIHG